MSTGPSRPLRLQVAGEKPGEGNPADPGQARLQVSRHEQGGGASVGPQGARPSLPALKDSICSHSLLEGGRNAGKAQGSRAARTVCVQVCERIWATVDTTRVQADVPDDATREADQQLVEEVYGVDITQARPIDYVHKLAGHTAIFFVNGDADLLKTLTKVYKSSKLTPKEHLFR